MTDIDFMKLALRLARRGVGRTSPNPMVGAVLVKRREVIGRGWHRQAGGPHAEVEAIRDASRRGHSTDGATLYVTLEPCSTHGRTPPCTDAIKAAGITRVVVGARDPNPDHAGRAFRILRRAGIEVSSVSPSHRRGAAAGRANLTVIGAECAALNESFNHWIVHRTPLVTVKAAMTLDGKIATSTGESKWITGDKARAYGMKLRQASDAILVGINTILADDPGLTVRSNGNVEHRTSNIEHRPLQRIVLDSMARTPLTSKVVTDEDASITTIVVSQRAPKSRVASLGRRVNVVLAPARKSSIDLRWLLRKLGSENVTSVLVEGGGEVNASFLLGGFAHRVAFFYAPKILGGREARKGVSGDGIGRLSDVIQLDGIRWRKLGLDLLLTARVR